MSIYESFIFGNDQIDSNVLKELERRSNFKEYSLTSKTPWSIITSGIQSVNDKNFVTLGNNDSFKNFNTLYDDQNRPVPTIESIDTNYLDEVGSHKEVTIKIMFHSKAQLEYYEPYFLLIGNSILVEWGINNPNYQYEMTEHSGPYYTKGINTTTDFYNKTQDRIKQSNYTYNNFLGIISEFDVSYANNDTYSATIKAYSIGYLAHKFPVQNITGINLISEVSLDNNKTTSLDFFVETLLPQYLKDIEMGDVDKLPPKFKALITRLAGPNRHTYSNVKMVDKTAEDDLFQYLSVGLIEVLIEYIAQLRPEEDGDIKEGSSLYSINSDFSIIQNSDALKSIDISKAFILQDSYPGASNLTNSVWQFNETNTVGYWKYIYINYEDFKEMVLQSQNVSDFFNSLYEFINMHFARFWDFKLVFDEASSTIYTVDLNIANRKKESPKPFEFKAFGGNSIIKELNFSTTSTEDQNLQTFYAARSKQKADSVGGDTNKSVLLWISDKDQYVDVFYNSGNLTTIIKKDDAEQSEERKAKLQEDFEDKVSELEDTNEDYGYLYTACQLKYDDKNIEITDLDELLKRKVYSDQKKDIDINPLIPLEVELVLDGISGIKIGNVITVDALPTKYNNNGVLQIVEITDSITRGGWDTRIKAIFRYTG